MWRERSLFLLLLLQVAVYATIMAQPQPEILVAPASMRVGLGHPTLQLTCRVRGQNIFWTVNNLTYGYTNSRDFRERGITFTHVSTNGDIITESGSVSVTRTNNNTAIACVATSGRDHIKSNASIIFIADTPLPPRPSFSIVNGSTVQVEWDEPFTWHDFPIIDYDVEVLSGTQTYSSTVLSSDTLSLSLTQRNLSCSNLTFSIRASNSVGYSVPGIVHGAFPYRPGEFLESPSKEVTFTKDRSPLLEINFTFPVLCPYHDATYQVDIEDANGSTVHTSGPHTHHWRESGSQVTMQIREGGLRINSHYVANITVSTLVGKAYVSLGFNTSFSEPTLQPTQPSTPLVIHLSAATAKTSTFEIVGASLGTFLLLLILGGLCVFAIYIYKHCVNRKRECHGTTEHAYPDVSKGMVPNPIYEGGGAIYETIPGPSNFNPLPAHNHAREDDYIAISPSAKINSDYPMLEKGEVNSMGGLGEETYTTMKPVGAALLGQSREGAAARSLTEQEGSVSLHEVDGASAKGMPSTEGRYVTIS